MNQIKYILVNLALLTANMMQAQTTPEAIIGQTPALPSAATLAAAVHSESDKSAAAKAVQTFRAKLKALSEKAGKAAMGNISEAEIVQARTQAVADAEKQAKAMTGKSVEQLKNMSDAEAQAVADKAMQQRMAEAGMGNMNLADMQNMSEDQLKATMAQKMGLTPAELKAMENMSDKEIEAYMKQGDRMQRVQNSSMAKAAEKNQNARPQLSDAEMNALQNAPEEQRKYMERTHAMRKLHEKERTELDAQIQTVRDRHYNTPSYLNAQKIWSDCGGKTIYTNAQCEAAAAQMRAAHIACDAECFNLLRNQVTKEQGRIKALLPDARRVDDLQSQLSKAQAKLNPNAMSGGITQKISGAGMMQYQLVNAYLNITESVIALPYNNN
jgi:hypothetical protein